MPRGHGIYDNVDEPDEHTRRSSPGAGGGADPDAPTPDVIEADDQDEPTG